MRDDKHYYVYITENLINHKKYIGKRQFSGDIQTDKYLGSGKALLNAIKKYGAQNFEKKILEECESYKECGEREKYWIEFFDAVNDDAYYNIASGGDGGNTYAGLSELELDRIRNIKREQSSGKNNPRYGVEFSQETRDRISDALKALYADKTRCSRYGKFGQDNPLSKKVYCVELDQVFCGIREASRELHIPSPNIIRALKHPDRWSAGKRDGKRLHWRYYED